MVDFTKFVLYMHMHVLNSAASINVGEASSIIVSGGMENVSQAQLRRRVKGDQYLNIMHPLCKFGGLDAGGMVVVSLLFFSALSIDSYGVRRLVSRLLLS